MWHWREVAGCSPRQLAQLLFGHLAGVWGGSAHSGQRGGFLPLTRFGEYSRTLTECHEMSILDGRLYNSKASSKTPLSLDTPS